LDSGDGHQEGEQPAAPGVLVGAGGRRDDSDAAHVCSDRQELSAQELHKLCLEDRTGKRELPFDKRKITGPLQWAGVLIEPLLRFTDCEFTDPIDLTGVRASAGIHLVACRIHSLIADRITVQGDLVLEKVQSDGPVSLSGARITGHLYCTGSDFQQAAGEAFNGQGMMVGGSALFGGDFRSAGEFNLAYAQIDGSLDMTGATLSNKEGVALMADGIRVGSGIILSADSTAVFKAEGTVRLAEARVSGKLRCTGGHFSKPEQRPAIDAQQIEPAIDAQRIEADEICFDDKFAATGEVRLDGGTVKGRVGCERGSFGNPGGIALRANGLTCGDIRLGHGFTATGEIQLMGARISRELNCSKGKFYNEKGSGNEKGDSGNEKGFGDEKRTALRADGLVCDGAVYLNDAFDARGEILLYNARIKTELNCTKGFCTSLKAGGMTCDGSVYLNKFKAPGVVDLTDATVGRELNCRDGEFGRLRAQRLTVGGTLDWRPALAPQKVDFSFANVGLLLDDPDRSWPRPDKQDGPRTDKKGSRTELAGFTFRDLGEKPTNADPIEGLTKRRIEWLDEASYAPGMYQQLTRIYRRNGWDRQAKRIAIAGQRDRRDRGGMSRPAKEWNRFLDYTVRYGYSLHRPLVVVFLAWIAGTIFFYLAQAKGLMEAVSPPQGGAVAETCTQNYPCFFPFAYAFEIFLPVINLRQVSFWLPTGDKSWGVALLVWVWLAIIFGWVITVAVAAGIGHLFSQRD
jgi:hypothetical protein